MTITYRHARLQDEENLLRLWVDVLEDSYPDRQLVFGDFVDDPQRFARTQVAIAPDGTLCGAAAYWLRYSYQADKAAVRLGHLWGMATHPDYRRQGIATELMARTVDAMQQEGCQWAVLFAREDARPLYARLGWQAIVTIYQGGFAVDNPPEVPFYQVQAYDPWSEKEGWQPLANVYADYNQHRSGSFVRSDTYWQGYVAWMARDWVSHQCARYWVVTNAEQNICGYALAHFYDQAYATRHFDSPPWFSISEIGLADHVPTEAMVALLARIAREAKAQQMVYGHLSVPQEARLEIALQKVFHQPLNREEVLGSMMARSIMPGSSSSQVAALFTMPGAWLWELDRY